MKNLIEVLAEFGDDSLTRLKDLFLSNDKNASGQFRDSLDWKLNFNVNKFIYEMEFTGVHYEQFIRKGRSANSKLPPSESIEKWMRYRNIPLKSPFPIQKAIAEKGILPFDFIDRNFNEVIIKELSKGITESLKDQITNKIITENNKNNK